MTSKHTEDYRVAAARTDLADSKAAGAADTTDDRPAAFWWGRVEIAALGLLEYIDEGKAAAPPVRRPTVDPASLDETSSLEELENVAKMVKTNAARQMKEAQQVLDTIAALKARDAG